MIARPFIGASGKYERTAYRKDYSLDPPSETILDILQQNKIPTVAIGKINDLFNYHGISIQVKSKSNNEGFNNLITAAKEYQNSLIFINLVDFDVNYGHRNDVQGFANALKQFDEFLPDFLKNLMKLTGLSLLQITEMILQLQVQIIAANMYQFYIMVK